MIDMDGSGLEKVGSSPRVHVRAGQLDHVDAEFAEGIRQVAKVVPRGLNVGIVLLPALGPEPPQHVEQLVLLVEQQLPQGVCLSPAVDPDLQELQPVVEESRRDVPAGVDDVDDLVLDDLDVGLVGMVGPESVQLAVEALDRPVEDLGD